ncbi:MAG: hypothetical protein HFJ72_08440 [Adlercreutzia sp.]|nr:hypothetical protein [Adlercreutzia sp.]
MAKRDFREMGEEERAVRAGLGFIVMGLLAIVAILASVTVGIFFGAGWGMLALTAMFAAAVLFFWAHVRREVNRDYPPRR